MRTSSVNGKHGVVIAGGGLAAQRCAEALRSGGFGGSIRMLCAEARRPYDRPPLSKQMLVDGGDPPSIDYRPAGWYDTQSVELLSGISATQLDLARRRVVASDETALRYDWLVIATGSRPRTLPLLEGFDNVTTLRTLDDSVALRDALSGGARLAVIGAGFIGQEVAASARKLGREVTMIEAAPAPLVGLLGHEVGDWFSSLHRSEGAEVLTSRTVRSAIGNGRVDALWLDDGSRREVDHVVVGVGVQPEVGWLAGSGLETVHGVLVDQHGRTGVERVLAAGDVAATFDPQTGTHLPGSHWEAASRQGACTARVILGLPARRTQLSSFWTDQYGLRIQYLGRAQLADRVEFDGDPDSRSFTVNYTRGGRPIAALLVNCPRSLPVARAEVEKGMETI